MNQYKFAIVINGTRHYVAMTQESADEVEAQEFLKTMQETNSLWMGLEDGNMISVSGINNKDIYFEAVKI